MTLFLFSNEAFFQISHLKPLHHHPQSPFANCLLKALNRTLLTPPVVNLKSSSPQISVLLSPAQFLEVKPRRKCRKKTSHAICWLWIWPASDHKGQVQVSQILLSCGVLSWCLHILCLHSWASCLNVRGIEADLALQNCNVFFFFTMGTEGYQGNPTEM